MTVFIILFAIMVIIVPLFIVILIDFLKDKKVKYIPAKEIEKFDPGARSFINLNTPQDANRHLGLDID